MQLAAKVGARARKVALAKAGASLIPLVLGACSASPKASADAGMKAPAWSVVLSGLTPSLLAVWGTAQDDVFAVGGSLGNGGPPALLHDDGQTWKDLGAGGADTFWWVNGTSDHDVWAVGTNGRITHWDGTRLVDHPSGTTATLYGVWAASTADVWVVGGTPGGGTMQPNDVLLHFDGTAFSPSALPMTSGVAFFKVWGTSSENLYVVGEAGTIWHRVGTRWSLEANQPKPLATGNLTTVAGCSATEVYAVGGLDVLVSDGRTWARADVTVENAGVNGVSCAAGRVLLVGFGGYRERGTAGHFTDDTTASPIINDFHGAWADPQGGLWAAGGHFIDMPSTGTPRDGMLAYYGTANVATTLSK